MKRHSTPEPGLIPKPASLRMLSGSAFHLTPATAIMVSPASAAARATAKYLAAVLRPSTGFPLPIRASPGSAESVIELRLGGTDRRLGTEGYTLQAGSRRLVVASPTAAGLFYGVQTLRQLLPPDIFSPRLITRTPWVVPALRIRDVPRFAWRGLMLDVARHFYDKASVLRFLDLMALHKFNTLHLHLTDDQGWRLQIRRYPKLTQVGARRTASPLKGDRKESDGIPYGPYCYTREDIRELVAHARQRFITVVPEIEMPGHALAALSAYPTLSCTGSLFQPRTRWGVEADVFCAGKDETFRFLENVLDEVIALFPSPFIHIGGDECPKDRWQKCPACQARIQAEGLKDEHELQSYFVRRMDSYLRSKGRRLLGWDEILEGGLADGAAVMSWRGTAGGIAAARAGHDVVMSPTTHCYLDFYQSLDTDREPEAIGAHLPLHQVYAYDPIPAELTPAQRGRILGVQGNLWSEYLYSWRDVDYMAYPRAAALAEVAWTPQAERDYDQFTGRLASHLPRLDLLGVCYRRPAREST